MELETHIEIRIMSRNVLLISGLSTILRNGVGWIGPADDGVRNLLRLRRRIDSSLGYCNTDSGSNEIIDPTVNDHLSRSIEALHPAS